jgi:hypothetical protein
VSSDGRCAAVERRKEKGEKENGKTRYMGVK